MDTVSVPGINNNNSSSSSNSYNATVIGCDTTPNLLRPIPVSFWL